MYRDRNAGSAAPRRSSAQVGLRWAGLFGLALLVGCATAAPPPPLTVAEVYRVGSPDQLTVTVLPEPLIEREVVVRPDGMISVDLIGDIPAAGRTISEIAGDIEKRMGRYKRDAKVTVSLVSSLSNQITVLGEVGRPSTFPLSRQTRVIEALGQVGGPRTFGSKGRIRLIRSVEGNPAIYNVDLAAIERGDLRTNIQLQGGDIIYVPPTPMASVGYALAQALFPLQQLLGFGASVTTTVVSGGTF